MKQNQGSVLIFELMAIFISSLVLVSILGYAAQQLRLLRQTEHKELAFQIAEAGVNFYQWRLAHFPTDYANGTGATCSPCGPYVRDYVDLDTGQVVGQYSLRITPPVVGSTVVTIESTGYTTAQPNLRRVVTVRYGIPSLAKYSLLTNTDIWVGNTETVSGEMHANGGIRFDGTANAPIRSSKTTYTCQTYHGCSPAQTKSGIWGSAGSATQAFWDFPAPTIDFSSMTADLATMKTNAQTAGIYLPPSSAQGYSVVFNSNATISIYRVTSLRAHATGTDVNGASHPEDLDYNARTQIDGDAGVAGIQSFSMPTNGLIYIEDRTWVEGTVAGRVLLAAARLPYNPATAPSILIPNSVVYTAKDGTVSLGLLAQKDILLTYFVPNTLEINAAMVAQNGSAQRYYFAGNTKTSITTYGSLASFGVWTWSWVNSGGTIISGYASTTTTYDSNLLYAPPPSFPLSTSGYQQLSWESN